MQNEVIKAIEDDHIQFFKRYLKYNYTLGQLVFVHLFQKWQQEEEIWLINDLNKKHSKDFKTISELGTIIEVIKTHYGDADYGDNHVLEIAYELHKTYINRIHKFHAKKVQKALSKPGYKWVAPGYTPKEAFKELVARGFLHGSLATNINISDSYYLKWVPFNLVYPEAFKDMSTATAAQLRIGLPGFTGINQPKPKK